MLTETDAKAKWCPMARVGGDPGSEAAGVSYNRWPGGHHEAAASCIASDCMAWRWFGFVIDDAWTEAVKAAAIEIGDKTPSRHKAADHVNKNRDAYGLSTEKLGFCGAFGQPK